MSKPRDTSAKAERVLVEVHRRLSPARKWTLLGERHRDARALHAAGLRRLRPSITAREITENWVRNPLGIERFGTIPENVRSLPVPTLQDFTEVATVFEQLGIAYALSGSMASSIHGLSRHTNDADVMVEPFAGKKTELVEALSPNYYASEPAIRQAQRTRTSFNLINTLTGFKIAVFVRPDRAFEQAAMARRISLDLEGETGRKLVTLSAEDVILFKLRWYRLGNDVSEQQWNDVIGVMKVQGSNLDRQHLQRWAKDQQIEDLLLRAWSEVSSSSEE